MTRRPDLVADPAAEVLFSAVSAWEIAIKSRTGRLEIGGRIGLASCD